MKIPHLRFPALAALLLLGLAGCATETTAKKEAKADDGEYEWVTPTGSNIAVKVRKGQKAATVASPGGEMTAEQLGAMRAGGNVQPKGGN